MTRIASIVLASNVIALLALGSVQAVLDGPSLKYLLVEVLHPAAQTTSGVDELVYSIRFDYDGRATFVGNQLAVRHGRFEGRVSLLNRKQLWRFLGDSGFFDYQGSYADKSVFDSVLLRVTVCVEGGEPRSVETYGYGGPVELWAIRMIADGLASNIEWQLSR